MRNHRRRAKALAVTVVSLFLFLARNAQAGSIAPCWKPFIFRDAAVNVIIIPYRYTGEGIRGTWDSGLSESGEQLATLVQRSILFSLLKYRSIGVIQLTEASEEDCNPESVRERVSIEPGHALILLWGRIYDENGDLYIQSYVRFERAYEEEWVNVAWPEDLRAKGLSHLVARLPAQSVAFAPRRIRSEDLKAIRGLYAEVLRVRQEPDPRLPGEPLISEEGFTYVVVDSREDWMKIEPFHSNGPRGWVRAKIEKGSWPLWEKMPELAFIDALAGYLRHRVAAADDSSRPAPAETLPWFENALDEFESSAGAGASREALALGRALHGSLLILEAEGTAKMADAMREAGKQFQRARQVMPYSAEARNLAAIAAIYRWVGSRESHEPETPARSCGKCHRKPRDSSEPKAGYRSVARSLAQQLDDALAVDPRNLSVVKNLEGFYSYLHADPSLTDLSAEEIERRLNAVESIHSYLEDRTPPGTRLLMTDEVVASDYLTLAAVGPQGEGLSDIKVVIEGRRPTTLTTDWKGLAGTRVPKRSSRLVARIPDVETAVVEARVIPRSHSRKEPPTIEHIPRYLPLGFDLQISGSAFDCPAWSPQPLRVGEFKIPVLACSPTRLLFSVAYDLPVGYSGPLTVTNDYGTSQEQTVTFVQVRGEDFGVIQQGHTGSARIFVEGTMDRVKIRIENLRPDVVALHGGNPLVVSTSGGEENFVLVEVEGLGPVGRAHLSFTLID